MQQPIQVSFRGLDRSPSIEARVYELAERLEHFNGRITSFHVTVHSPPQHRQRGGLFDVRIQIHVPGKEIMVCGDGTNDHSHEDVYVALRDAFETATRKLEEYVRKHR